MINENILIEEFEKRMKDDNVMCPVIKVLDVLEIIEEQPKVGEWIPCSERLPENNTNVIACFCTETVTELLYEGEGKFRGLYEYPKDVIVAWMPLPPAYKE